MTNYFSAGSRGGEIIERQAGLNFQKAVRVVAETYIEVDERTGNSETNNNESLTQFYSQSRYA